MKLLKTYFLKLIPFSILFMIILSGCSSHIAIVKRENWDKQQEELDQIKGDIHKLTKLVTKLNKQQSKDLRLITADLNMLFGDVNRNLSKVSGQLEENDYKLKNLNKTTKKLSERKYILKNLRKKMQDSTSKVAPSSDSIIIEDKVDVQKLFKIARQDFNSKDYDRAQKEFNEILLKYRDDELADDCAYWVGECDYIQKRYKAAIESYRMVVKAFPKGDVLAMAIFKAGMCYKKLRDEDNMKAAWQTLISKYPDTDEAMIAKARLGL